MNFIEWVRCLVQSIEYNFDILLNFRNCREDIRFEKLRNRRDGIRNLSEIMDGDSGDFVEGFRKS